MKGSGNHRRITIELTREERARLDGAYGEGVRLAMSLIVRLAEAGGAERLIEITAAHIDSCLYHGQASLDFAERLHASGARVSVPTTLNVGSLDLLHPH